MRNEFSAIVFRDGDWFVGFCPEVPEANGQGRTVDECRQNLADSIELLFEVFRDEGLRGIPEEAIRCRVVVE